ncbi:enoyl-CoA hydratase/isomerase family protein [Nocardioides sp. JQ2195]|uniref:enoyl-CoA hydratase/isomerase family protein n=1 Tax=Nocardioides sp. JQ2195 TaxID=2592334 RepID=UPI00143EEE90|nr:enoyl-CoA hydratase/isomerase family protein [Nocardioides sp. JQ2195]QIX25601.1 enoyl-CoA hydratase/isomerase family protein [Nocardioides sp. JQ2195]
MTDLVSYSVSDGVAHIELNRPEVSNAVDLPTAHAFDDAVKEAAADDAVRVVLLTGAGKRFCAGGDVASMVASDGDQSAYLLELAGALDGALQRLAALEKPVVAAVQGAVAGAGLGVMLSCDLVVAAPGTKFVIAYPGVGLTPDCGVSWLLPRAIGQQRALQMALTNRPIDSDRALDWGLVTEVGEQDRAVELAGELAAGSVFAFGQARRLVRGSFESDRASVGRDEAETIAKAVATDDAQRLLTAFTKR